LVYSVSKCCFEQLENTGRSSAQVVSQIQVSQSLSSYADYPEDVAKFMVPFLGEAIDAVPADLQPETPVLFGVRIPSITQIYLIY
jgi:hypothetical protein